MNYKIIILLIVSMLLFRSMVAAQSLETYAGHKRTGVDLMWFKNFKNTKEERTPLLFFSRNRASVDYENSPTAFGSTNAISYNFKSGIGIVVVASFLNPGFTPKTGVQYYKNKGNFMFFGWLVADLKKEGNVDCFGLFRYQHNIKGHWKGFEQLELFPVFNPTTGFWNITQRLRTGVKHHAWAAGLMMDFNQMGKESFTKANNLGGFLRWEF